MTNPTDAETAPKRTTCPCTWTTPCNPHCTCVRSYMSGGCTRCCRYGSDEQRKAMAELIVENEQRLAAALQAKEEAERIARDSQTEANKAWDAVDSLSEAIAGQKEVPMKTLLERVHLLVGAEQRADAAERELERWRHGQTIEGDFVCPNELRADAAEVWARDEAKKSEIVGRWYEEEAAASAQVLELIEAAHKNAPGGVLNDELTTIELRRSDWINLRNAAMSLSTGRERLEREPSDVSGNYPKV